MNNQNTSANDPSNCSPIAAKRSSFHTLEVSCLRHLSLQVPPFCMCGSSHKGCLGANLLAWTFSTLLLPLLPHEMIIGATRELCDVGDVVVNAPEPLTMVFVNMGPGLKKLHLCCVDCVDFLQIGLVLGSSGASFACLL